MSVDLRFNVFIAATTSEARDWIAFYAFEDAVHEVADTATLVNKYDNSDAGQRELDALKPVVSEMLYRLLPKVGINNVFANQYGIGYALRYGVIEPRRDALDDVKNLKDLEALAQKGYDADDRQTDMRIEVARKQQAADDERRKARARERRREIGRGTLRPLKMPKLGHTSDTRTGHRGPGLEGPGRPGPGSTQATRVPDPGGLLRLQARSRGRFFWHSPLGITRGPTRQSATRIRLDDHARA